MANPQEDRVWAVLQQVRFPGMSRDIVSFGFVDRVEASDDGVTVELVMATHNQDAAAAVRAEAEERLKTELGIEQVEVGLRLLAPPAPAHEAISQDASLIPEVEHVVAVASGKGGVGKSTVSANLAVRLGQLGYRVGLLDADIYGPSMPMMFGISERPVVEGQRILPFERHGVKLMSLGFILDVDTPVIWRGPMVVKAIEQLLGDVEWGALDYLIVDLPPGTGDAQLTISQKVPISGAVIVTTPQDIALIDARKGLAMFRKVEVPVLGIVENMAGFACPHCGEVTHIFKQGGGESTAGVLDCPFLGSVPLDPAVVEGGDAGTPIVVSQSDGVHAEAFAGLAEAVAAELSKRQARKLSIF
ncbi:MAG: Mrp/NBP35 family ATP-binding protein [Thermoanaerobaculia bacterium]